MNTDDPQWIEPGDPRYDGFRIQELYLVVSVDVDDQEGIVQFPTEQGYVPLFAADARRLELIIEAAHKMHEHDGGRMQIIKLSTREVVETIE